MNNYELLLNFFSKKISTYKNTLNRNVIKKEEIQRKIENLQEQIQSCNTEITKKANILEEVNEAEEKVIKIIKEFMILGLFGFGIGIILGITSVLIATQYTPSILAHLTTFIITFVTSTAISITCDYYRAKKEIEPLRDVIENNNVIELTEEKEKLLGEVKDLTQELAVQNERFDKKTSTINKITNLLLNLQIKEISLKNHYKESKKELGPTTDENYNKRFNEDTHLREIMNLSRKK